MDTNYKKKYTHSKRNQTWSGKTFGLFFAVGLFPALVFALSLRLEARARALSHSFRFASMWFVLFLRVVHPFGGHITDDISTYAHIDTHTLQSPPNGAVFFPHKTLYARSRFIFQFTWKWFSIDDLWLMPFISILSATHEAATNWASRCTNSKHYRKIQVAKLDLLFFANHTNLTSKLTYWVAATTPFSWKLITRCWFGEARVRSYLQRKFRREIE